MSRARELRTEPATSNASATRPSGWVYINTSKRVGDAGHIRVFVKLDAAEKWFEENDPEGGAFEYDVLE